jgi:hypothetical protein
MSGSSIASLEPTWFLASLNQSVVEDLACAFFVLLFFVAVAVSAAGALRRPRLARAMAGAESGAKPGRIFGLSGARSGHGIWTRCLWEINIFKAYLTETFEQPRISRLTTATAPGPSAKPKPAQSPEDRRRWTRHPSNLQALCWLANRGKQGKWRVRVRDISEGGVGLLSPCPAPLGTIIDFQLLSGEPVDDAIIRAEVMFMGRNAAGDWTLGCEFLNPLGASQRQAHL